MDEPSTPEASDAAGGRSGTEASIAAVARELSDAAHEAATAAGRLDEIARAAGDDVDPDTQLLLDQAHSNASAVIALLTELGYG